MRTFADSNGDGIGDLKGLTDRLDYIAALGVTTLWLLPFQPSPWRDDGYDVTDYYGVHPALRRPRRLRTSRRAGKRPRDPRPDDLVLNHTSTEHPWFQAARAGDPGAYRDYYVWAEERPRTPRRAIVFPGVRRRPGHSTARPGGYYFHRFYDFQPDLNIANPAVRDEIEKIIGFWLRPRASPGSASTRCRS